MAGKISDKLFARLLLLFIFVACLFVSFKTTKRRKVADVQLPIDSLSKTKPLVTPSFPVKKKVGIYSLKMSVYPHMTHVNGDFIYLMAEMYDSEDRRINEFENEYWWETGHDSDGTWTEKEESESWMFKNRQKNDSLYLEIYGEKSLSKSLYYHPKSVRIQVWEDPQAAVAKYFLVIGIVFLVLFIIFLFT
ncbi:hypothetical protein [Microscilla marina]|uniref:Uncharacterized protein n=1 Tax=Microscilla marina ATCC 23134 TaxID=313606 RepID=A1ZS60_MICM2|nr:hypothetical protein [Microscilla marina]EAY26783.1 hypothetical protein M23134_00749 [Microscilla marina ATCC 23134]